MIVTIEWMEEWFRRFDQEYFGGKLPVPELGLTHAKTRLGQLAYKRASRWGRTKLYDFKLSMSTYYDMTDKQAKSVLLHEMIHYIIGYTGLKDTSAHGVVFKGLMDKLNSQYGWDIRVSTSTKGWKVSETVKSMKEKKGPQIYLMLAIEMNDGRHYLLESESEFCPSHRKSTEDGQGSGFSSVVYYDGELFRRLSAGAQLERKAHLEDRFRKVA